MVGRVTRPEFARRSITPAQVNLLAGLLNLAPGTAQAAQAVLFGRLTQQAAADAAGVHRPHVSRALSSLRRLDAAIVEAYPLRRMRPAP